MTDQVHLGKEDFQQDTLNHSQELFDDVLKEYIYLYAGAKTKAASH